LQTLNNYRYYDDLDEINTEKMSQDEYNKFINNAIETRSKIPPKQYECKYSRSVFVDSLSAVGAAYEELGQRTSVSIEELNEVVRNYEATGAPLSGPKLRSIFLQGFNKKESGISEKLIIQAIKHGVTETIDDRTILDDEAITAEVLNMALNTLHKQSGGKRKIKINSDKIVTHTAKNGNKYISLKGLTKAQKNAFKLLKEVAKEEGIVLKNQSIISSEVINDNETEIGVNWGELTKGLKASEAKMQVSPEELA
jgi:hypothetical protein